MLDTAEAVNRYLTEHRVLVHISHQIRGNLRKEPEIRRIPGGVSNRVWRIDVGDESFILKQPLHRLAVEEEWISGTGRLDIEVAALRALSEWIPGSVPVVHFHDSEHKVCIMAAAPDGSISWKSQMMNGSFNSDVAWSVGKTLRAIHSNSRLAPESIQGAFDSLVYFQELRIDPFHRFVASRHSDLKRPIEWLISDLLENRSCFVHGDYSPKNILVDPDGGLTVIDLEVAHWGNPVFDLAYCLGHLMLKGWHLGRAADALESIRAFIGGYGSMPDRLLNHVGLMLLARVDGKSTVEYLKDAPIIEMVRNAGRSMLTTKQNPDSITDLGKTLEGYLT